MSGLGVLTKRRRGSTTRRVPRGRQGLSTTFSEAKEREKGSPAARNSTTRYALTAARSGTVHELTAQAPTYICARPRVARARGANTICSLLCEENLFFPCPPHASFRFVPFLS
jgi:hypothetical protein